VRGVLIVMMRLTVVAILLFVFLAWDMSRNDGYYTRQANGYLYDFARKVGWR
jgi:hypothetical protein